MSIKNLLIVYGGAFNLNGNHQVHLFPVLSGKVEDHLKYACFQYQKINELFKCCHEFLQQGQLEKAREYLESMEKSFALVENALQTAAIGSLNFHQQSKLYKITHTFYEQKCLMKTKILPFLSTVVKEQLREAQNSYVNINSKWKVFHTCFTTQQMEEAEISLKSIALDLDHMEKVLSQTQSFTNLNPLEHHEIEVMWKIFTYQKSLMKEKTLLLHTRCL